MGTAGDRPDGALRGIGRIAASRADQVAIKETLRHLRGRTRQSVVGERLAGMAAACLGARDVPVYKDEPLAVRGEWLIPCPRCDRAAAGSPAPHVPRRP